MPQFAGNPAMAAAFGLAHNAQQQPPPPSYASSSKERSAVLSHDRDILSRDRDRDMFNRDRDYYNKVTIFRKIKKLLNVQWSYVVF